jgi:hypothetical protein
MTLDVSGAEFVSAFNRIQFTVRELRDRMAAEIPANGLDTLALQMLVLMDTAQRQGLPLAARVVEHLRAACGPQG